MAHELYPNCAKLKYNINKILSKVFHNSERSILSDSDTVLCKNNLLLILKSLQLTKMYSNRSVSLKVSYNKMQEGNFR